MVTMGTLHRSAVALMVAAVGACKTDAYITAPQPTTDEIFASVAGAAQTAIGPEGRFVLSPPAPTVAPQITVGNATGLAVIWSRQFGPLFRELLEGVHGGPIRLEKLAPCGRPLYAASAFEEPPLEMLPSLRRAYGPWWLITLCDAKTPTVSVAVSAWATELTIENGAIKFPVNSGIEFYPHGIPLGHTGEYPVSPERAAVSTAQQVGRRVTSVPYLIAGAGRLGHPGHARWQWSLESAVVVRTEQGRSPSVAEVFMGEAVPVWSQEVLYVPAATQPDTVQVKSPPPLIYLEPREEYEERVRTQTRIFTLNRRTSIPAVFDRVLRVEGQ